jgi:hypothetical protein
MDPIIPQDAQELGVTSPVDSPTATPPPVAGPATTTPTPPPVPGSIGEVVSSTEDNAAGDGKNKKKIFVIGGIVTFLLLVIGAAIYFAPRITSRLAQTTQVEVAAPTATPVPVVASAKVTYLEGTAWILSEGVNTPIYEDDEIEEGNTIETGEESKLTLSLEGGSILRLGPATKVVLTNLDSLDLAFSEEAGSLFAYVEKGVGRFVVAAGEVSVEAVGTAFSVEREEEVQVNVYESSVKVKEKETETNVEENSTWVQGTEAPETLNSTEVANDNFLQWALEEEIRRMEAEIVSQVAPPENAEDKEAYIATLKALGVDKKELLRQAYLKTTTGEVGTITLTGEKTPEGAVALSWTANGLAEAGYKIVWSKTPGKAYPGDKRTFNPLYGYEKTLGPMKPGTGTWYFRVCEWLGETCGVYSNELSFSF